MKVRLKGKKFINTVVSHTDEVQGEVKRATEWIESRADAILQAHRDNSDAQHHSISSSMGDTDGYVTMSGPAPMSLEFGHMLVYFGKPTHKYIQGLHILYRAAGLM
jgi:hypothetical protein